MSLGRLGGQSVGQDPSKAETATSDSAVESVLNKVLMELEKISFYLSIMTDTTIENEDVGDGNN